MDDMIYERAREEGIQAIKHMYVYNENSSRNYQRKDRHTHRHKIIVYMRKRETETEINREDNYFFFVPMRTSEHLDSLLFHSAIIHTQTKIYKKNKHDYHLKYRGCKNT